MLSFDKLGYCFTGSNLLWTYVSFQYVRFESKHIKKLKKKSYNSQVGHSSIIKNKKQLQNYKKIQ